MGTCMCSMRSCQNPSAECFFFRQMFSFLHTFRYLGLETYQVQDFRRTRKKEKTSVDGSAGAPRTHAYAQFQGLSRKKGVDIGHWCTISLNSYIRILHALEYRRPVRPEKTRTKKNFLHKHRTVSDRCLSPIHGWSAHIFAIMIPPALGPQLKTWPGRPLPLFVEVSMIPSIYVTLE